MTRASPAITLLFWTMFIVGGVSLAVSMVLPVWLDYRAEVQRTDAAEKRRDEAKKRLVA
ncbi:MAG: hypothetical protein HZB38_08475, partial [Planctomycetes bacterium]|nr:hypothetical protein [Planctomycetota bacterium]